jgi:hypothetical protein
VCVHVLPIFWGFLFKKKKFSVFFAVIFLNENMLHVPIHIYYTLYLNCYFFCSTISFKGIECSVVVLCVCVCVCVCVFFFF